VNGIKLSLALSLAGHAACLALLILFLSDTPAPLPEPVAKGGIEVVFQPALPSFEAAPLPEPALQPETPPPPTETPPPEPPIEVVPPTPEPVVVAREPDSLVLRAPAVVSEPAPPPEASVAASEPSPPVARKPAAKKPKPVPRSQEVPQPSQAYLPPAPSQLPTTQTSRAVTAPPQTASAMTAVPAPAPSPEASAGYRGLLSAWLESHKRYPDAARQRGEEGHAVLRFEVERSGRVVDYEVTKSSGYPDLDQSIEDMMRGANLPPFPAGVSQSRMQVSVTIRFSLRR
jgi:periplasmic protein TonB